MVLTCQNAGRSGLRPVTRLSRPTRTLLVTVELRVVPVLSVDTTVVNREDVRLESMDADVLEPEGVRVGDVFTAPTREELEESVVLLGTFGLEDPVVIVAGTEEDPGYRDAKRVEFCAIDVDDLP